MIACGEMLMSHRSPGKNGPIPTANLSPWTLHKNPNFTARLILTFLRLQSGKSDIFTSKVDALTSYDVPVFIGNHIRRAVSYFFFSCFRWIAYTEYSGHGWESCVALLQWEGQNGVNPLASGSCRSGG